jgi:plasmid stabilization system protein ParE
MIYLKSFNESLCLAVDYYNAIDRKVATRFVNEVDTALRQISKFPKSGRAFPKYRTMMLKEFPYSICYCEHTDGNLYGLVLFHHKQKEPYFG